LYLPRSHSLHEESLLSGTHLVSHGDGVSRGREGVSFLKGRERRRSEGEGGQSQFGWLQEREKGTLESKSSVRG